MELKLLNNCLSVETAFCSNRTFMELKYKSDDELDKDIEF